MTLLIWYADKNSTICSTISQTNIRSFPSQNHNKINHITTSKTNYNDDNNKDDGNMKLL